MIFFPFFQFYKKALLRLSEHDDVIETQIIVLYLCDMHNNMHIRKSHRDYETMFGAASKEIHKTLFPGDRSFKEFSHSHNAPGSSPLSVQDTDFTTSDRCK